MSERRSGFADSTELKAQCEAFRQHLETAISADLISKLTGNGLSEVIIRQPEVAQRYGEIRNRIVAGALTTLSGDEITFIADKVITKDPKAEFYDAHPALSAAIQKYHIVKTLLEKVDEPQQFRSHFLRNLRELLRERDKDVKSTGFVTDIGRKIGVQPASMFFPSQDNVVNDAVIRNDKSRYRP